MVERDVHKGGATPFTSGADAGALVAPHNTGLLQTATSAVGLLRVTILAAGRCSPSVGGQHWSLQRKPRPLGGTSGTPR
jgi:hypothetical protein